MVVVTCCQSDFVAGKPLGERMLCQSQSSIQEQEWKRERLWHAAKGHRADFKPGPLPLYMRWREREKEGERERERERERETHCKVQRAPGVWRFRVFLVTVVSVQQLQIRTTHINIFSPALKMSLTIYCIKLKWKRFSRISLKHFIHFQHRSGSTL